MYSKYEEGYVTIFVDGMITHSDIYYTNETKIRKAFASNVNPAKLSSRPTLNNMRHERKRRDSPVRNHVSPMK